MYAIDVTSAASSLPTPAAPGTAGFFTDGNPLTATAATILPADFLNALMLELLNVVTAGGLTPSKTTNTQVRDAIKELIQQQTGNYALDTGSANAYVVAFSPVISAYTNGLAVRFKAAHANTGASTFNAGGGAVALVDDAGNALVSGAIGVGSLVTAVYDSIANAFFATSITTPVFNPSGQCQLSVSGGNLKLSPYQGNRLTINGAPQAIPSGGVSLGTGTVAAHRQRTGAPLAIRFGSIRRTSAPSMERRPSSIRRISRCPSCMRTLCRATPATWARSTTSTPS
jgi:hypothetical protein